MFPVMMLDVDSSPSFSLIYLLWSQAVVPSILHAQEPEHDISSLVVDGASQIAVMRLCMNSCVTSDTCISCHKCCCIFSFKGRWF